MTSFDKERSPQPKALVTGASGQLGSRLVKKLTNSGWKVFAISRNNSFLENSLVTHVAHNWAGNWDLQLPQVDFVFHLAAQTSSYVARKDVSEDVRTNLLGSVCLLDAIARTGTNPVFVFAGSMTEYGITKEEFISESSPIQPQTFYDSAKVATEIYAEQFAREGWLEKSITLRLSNVYGNSSQNQGADRGFLDRSIWRALRLQNLTYFGSGEYKRDFLYIDDVVDALFAVTNNSKNLTHSAYNIGTSVGTSIRHALKLVTEESELLTSQSVRLDQARFPDDAYQIERRSSIADTRLFHSLTGWRPKVSLRQGIRQSTIDSWKFLSTQENYD